MPTSVAVIGTIFMDCKGFAKQRYNPAGRNLGSVKFVHGGVGRNVAENMANLGVKTSFVSSVDKSGVGKEVLHRLSAVGINLDYVLETEVRGMGLWLAILDDSGDLAGSVSQMPDLVVLENYIAEKGDEFISRTSHIVLELDLNEHITRQVIGLAKNANRPVYGIPGNLSVILDNMDILSGLTCFICNNIEAGRLIGKDLSNIKPEELQKELIGFVDKTGLGSMVITLGAEGCVYFDSRSRHAGYQPIFPATVVDTSGAGDAFFSGTVMGLIKGNLLKQAVVFGSKVASWTIQSNENTCRDLAGRIERDKLFTGYKKAREK